MARGPATSGSTACSVLVVDDDADIRGALRALLERDDRFVVVGEAADAGAAIDRATALQPAVALVGLGMPGMDGLEALPHIGAAAPRCAVVVLSGADSPHADAGAVLAAGAAVFVVKGQRPDRLPDEVWDVLRAPCSTGSRRTEPSPTRFLPPWRARGRPAGSSTTPSCGGGARTWRTRRSSTSELVTNAVVHASSEATLMANLLDRRVRIRVEDRGPGALRFREADPTETSGRGLHLIEAIAANWGTSATAASKAVWFELPVPQEPAAGEALAGA